MDVKGEKSEQVVLALFQMNLCDDSERRAWKSLPWILSHGARDLTSAESSPRPGLALLAADDGVRGSQ